MKLAVTHRNSSSLKVANNTIISHFCTCALAGATRLCACEHARSSHFSQQSLLLLLGLAQFHDRKPIFRGALCNNRTLSTLSLSLPLYPSSVPRVSAHPGHDRSRNATRNGKSRPNISTGIFEKSCSILPEKSFYTDSKHFTFTKNFPYPLIKTRVGESGTEKEPTGISALLQQTWF